MERKTIQFPDKEDKYVVSPYSVFKGMAIQQKLASTMMGLIPLLKAEGDVDLEALSGVFEQGAFKDEDGLQKLVVKILENDVIYVDASGNEKRVDSTFINTHFRGKYMEMYKLVFQVVSYQFADFFEDGMLGLTV